MRALEHVLRGSHDIDSRFGRAGDGTRTHDVQLGKEDEE